MVGSQKKRDDSTDVSDRWLIFANLRMLRVTCVCLLPVSARVVHFGSCVPQMWLAMLDKDETSFLLHSILNSGTSGQIGYSRKKRLVGFYAEPNGREQSVISTHRFRKGHNAVRMAALVPELYLIPPRHNRIRHAPLPT